MKRGRGGFTTVYLLMILAALTTAVVMIIDASTARAARSISETVCASAGRSVLSEYQKELYSRYGVFALRGDDALLTRLASFYVNGSLLGGKAAAKPVALKIEASAESYPALDVEGLAKQIRKLAPAAAVMKGDVLEYILSNSDAADPLLPDGAAADPGGEEADPIRSAEKSFGKDSDRNRGRSIASNEYRALPSRLLGYSRRVSLLFSGGIFGLSFRTLLEDEYILAVCSNAVKTKSGTFLECETEYVLYGSQSDAANLRAVKISLFSFRFAVNEVKYASETGELLISTAAAIAKSLKEVKTILAGGRVDKLDYAMYLRIFMALVPRQEKVARLMDVMQLNIKKIDGANFEFRNYAYGFDLRAVFVHRRRTGDVEQSFCYR
ncbi:MAG: hypothetical protein IKX89_06670 [Firmicutes bacterium]|nr:hypothetical protein [Bacillota bacterium]